MKALRLISADGHGSVRLAEVDLPEPRLGEARVKVHAAALNHRELWIARGQYPGMSLPCTMGCDGSGVIDALGEGVGGLGIGSEVALYPGLDWGDNSDFPSPKFGLLGMPGPGTIAEYICVPAENVVAKPLSLTFEEAAATGLAGLTAWRGLVTKARLKAGERVFISGIGGGVATFALRFAVAMGATVFVSSGSTETLEAARDLGAAGGFNYTDPDWRKAVPKVTGGIDVVFDGAPAGSYANYARAIPEEPGVDRYECRQPRGIQSDVGLRGATPPATGHRPLVCLRRCRRCVGIPSERSPSRQSHRHCIADIISWLPSRIPCRQSRCSTSTEKSRWSRAVRKDWGA